MTYASDFTGGDADSRRAEADRIIKILEGDLENLAPRQRAFVEQMADGGEVSGKQLLWLRDIKDSL